MCWYRNSIEVIDVAGVGKCVSAIRLTQAITGKKKKDARNTLNGARTSTAENTYMKANAVLHRLMPVRGFDTDTWVVTYEEAVKMIDKQRHGVGLLEARGPPASRYVGVDSYRYVSVRIDTHRYESIRIDSYRPVRRVSRAFCLSGFAPTIIVLRTPPTPPHLSGKFQTLLMTMIMIILSLSILYLYLYSTTLYILLYSLLFS